MKDFAIVNKVDALGNLYQDQKIIDNDIAIVDGKDEMVQNLKIRLQFFYGEWFLDTSKGLRYFDNVFVKNPNIANINREFKRIILTTDNVIRLLSFNSEFYNTERKIKLNFKLLSTYGEIVFNDTLVIGE